ncbi:MAG: hypothetical protein WD296_07430 [Acidimicrobiia bacterium]
MDIEQFYDADPRRRESEEVEFGRDWSDGSGVRSELSWVADTGELYVMWEPDAPIDMDPVGDVYEEKLPTEAVTVEVLGVFNSREAVDQLLEGWEDAMVQPDSLAWVRARVAQLN